MSTLRIEVVREGSATEALEPDQEVVRVGRGEHNDIVLDAPHVSREHARILVGNRVIVEDLGSASGTAVIRGAERTVLYERGDRAELRSGDVIVFGADAPQDAAPALRVEVGQDTEPAHVVAVRPLAELPATTASTERDSRVLRTLSEVHRAIVASDDLDAVLGAVADAALALVPRATHATLVLRQETAAGDADRDAAYVPVLTRVRDARGAATAPNEPVRVTRSVFRKVVRDRAAVIAADASAEGLSSESLLGASIRSTIGVPLWRRDEIIGVLQVDNRDSPAMFEAADVDTLGVLAANASLAVANAQLIRRLTTAERQLEDDNEFLRGRERARRGTPLDIIGQSRAMRELLAQVDRVADTRVSVLIEGQTGTGKELVASAIHYRSRRRSRLFVAQNCAAMPENLLESELFGHKRGAFTGATEEKKGLFEVADGGTLFLDEVTEMAPSLQAKLLRALQEGEIRPVGAMHVKHVDVRIVAATNRDIEREVQAGNFREDLYYRLKVFPLRLPALRERRDDIPLLAGHFLTRYSKEIGKPIAGYSQQAMEMLMSYDWPGNVRELENEVQRLVIQADDGAFLTPDLLSPRVRKVESVVTKAGVAKGTLKEMVDQVEKHLLIEALREHGNNKTNAAKALGITREGLHKKLRQLKIT